MPGILLMIHGAITEIMSKSQSQSLSIETVLSKTVSMKHGEACVVELNKERLCFCVVTDDNII